MLDHAFALILGILDSSDLFIGFVGLCSTQNIHESRMAAVVHKERHGVNRGVMVIIVHKFHHWKQIHPVILPVGAEHAKVGFHPLVVVVDFGDDMLLKSKV